jgi:hypothetical protein
MSPTDHGRGASQSTECNTFGPRLKGLGERMLVRFAKSLGEQKFSGATAKYTLANA